MSTLRNIVQRIGQLPGLRKRGTAVLSREEYEARMAALRNEIDYGVRVDNDTAMRVTAVYAAIRLRSENIASLPKRVTRRTGRGEETERKHPVSLLMRRPNGYMNTFNFWDMVNASMDGWGNAYAVIERDSHGDPLALHPLLPQTVTTVRNRGKKFFRVAGDLDGFNGVYSNEEMCHFMLLSLDGQEGLNPIEYNAIALAKGIAATKFGAEFYKKGGNIRAVLEGEGSMSDKEYESFMRHFKLAAQNYETPMLEYGIKYKPVGISPVAAQLLQTETFSIQDIARIFNVPPHMLSEMSHATFSNIEHQTIQFTIFSLRPSVKRIEAELEEKLFFEDEAGEYDVKFDLNGLMRGDTNSRAEWYRTGIQNGFLSRNDVRRMEGFPALEGLDEMLYPGNMVVGGKEMND